MKFPQGRHFKGRGCVLSVPVTIKTVPTGIPKNCTVSHIITIKFIIISIRNCDIDSAGRSS